MITNTDLFPQRYHFLLGMVKDLNVFPFDNDMKKAHFGTKLCIYHEKTVSVYQRNTIFTVYLKKIWYLKFSLIGVNQLFIYA